MGLSSSPEKVQGSTVESGTQSKMLSMLHTKDWLLHSFSLVLIQLVVYEVIFESSSGRDAEDPSVKPRAQKVKVVRYLLPHGPPRWPPKVSVRRQGGPALVTSQGS